MERRFAERTLIGERGKKTGRDTATTISNQSRRVALYEVRMFGRLRYTTNWISRASRPKSGGSGLAFRSRLRKHNPRSTFFSFFCLTLTTLRRQGSQLRVIVVVSSSYPPGLMYARRNRIIPPTHMHKRICR